MTPTTAIFGFLCLFVCFRQGTSSVLDRGPGSIKRNRISRQAGANIDAALRNPSFVRFQLACLLDRGSCDRIGQRIKSLLPEMVATGHCTQCSPQEIGQAGKVIIFIQENYPREYDMLEKKFMQDTELQEDHNEDII